MVIPFELAFLLRWTKIIMNNQVEKSVNFVGNLVIAETIVHIYPHFKFFLSQLSLFKYFIDNAVYYSSIDKLLKTLVLLFLIKSNDINK